MTGPESAAGGDSRLAAPLAAITAEFAAVDDADRLTLLVEYGEDLPALPERYAAHRERLEQVPECQSPLFLAAEVDPGGKVRLFFDVPAQAPVTRGFAGVLHAGLDGLDAGSVLATPAAFTTQLGLDALVSPLRLRGMSAMLGRLQRQVRERRG